MGLDRRTFVRLVGTAAAAWPHAACTPSTWWPKASGKGSDPVRRPDPAVKRPVIGYLSGWSAEESRPIVAAFHAGLKEAGYVEAMNVLVESRFADGQVDRIPDLAKELARRPVTVLVATGGAQTAVRAKPMVPPIMPIVFAMNEDPVKLGLMTNLARPGNNITGIRFVIDDLAAKGVEIVHELLPKATLVGFLVNPDDPDTEPRTRGAQTAADALGLKLVVVGASTESAIDAAFDGLTQQRVGVLLVDVARFLTEQRRKITALAARHALPTVYPLREFVDAGGLLSYGISIADANRQLGVYTTQVLRGARPGDLPVIQATKHELVINRRVAQVLLLPVPRTMLVRADEVRD
jgi:putative ABC transport system substrate-binding protein